MTNSNFKNVQGKQNFRTNSSFERSNNKGKFNGNRDSGGFRIRLSDNEMKAVKSIQETFQLKSTIAVLGFSIRTLSEILKDKNMKDKILNDLSLNNKNTSNKIYPTNQSEDIEKKLPDPFARPNKTKIMESKTQKDNDLNEK
tara:strand:+ start:2733 stop:3158 length:426 start_codon:yes stop_codon:yes gene_type:complete